MRMPKQQEIFTSVAIECHSYERLLAVLQNVVTIILLCVSEGVEKLFEETVYKLQDKEEKKKQRRTVAFGT